MAVKPYRVALISEELRFEIARLDGGEALAAPDRGRRIERARIYAKAC